MAPLLLPPMLITAIYHMHNAYGTSVNVSLLLDMVALQLYTNAKLQLNCTMQ